MELSVRMRTMWGCVNMYWAPHECHCIFRAVSPGRFDLVETFKAMLTVPS